MWTIRGELFRDAFSMLKSAYNLDRGGPRIITQLMSRSAHFKSDGLMTEIKMWRHSVTMYIAEVPNEPSIFQRSFRRMWRNNVQHTHNVRGNGRGRLTNAWIVGILRGDKGKRSRSDRKSNCKSFSLGKSRLEFRSKL